MSASEIDRLDVIQRVRDGCMTQVEAAELLGVTARQVRRLEAAYARTGAAGLVSKKRGRPSNNAIAKTIESNAMELVQDRYADFGPTLASSS